MLFLLYINDIVYVVKHVVIRLFADDTCLFIEVDVRFEAALMLEEDLCSLDSWAKKWLISFAQENCKQ